MIMNIDAEVMQYIQKKCGAVGIYNYLYNDGTPGKGLLLPEAYRRYDERCYSYLPAVKSYVVYEPKLDVEQHALAVIIVRFTTFWLNDKRRHSIILVSHTREEIAELEKGYFITFPATKAWYVKNYYPNILPSREGAT